MSNDESPPPSETGIFTKYILSVTGITLVIIAVWIALEYGSVVNFVNLSLPVRISPFAEIMSALASLGLTFALVILYDRQAGIQFDQKQLMENQESIMSEQTEVSKTQVELTELEHEPRLNVRGVFLSDSKHNFEIIVSNHGKGVAENVVVDITPDLDYPEAPDEEFNQQITSTVPWRKMERKDGVRSEGCYISPGERELHLGITSSLYISNHKSFDGNDNTPASFEFASEMLSNAGKEYIRLIFDIYYTDINGTEFEEEFADLILPIKGRTSLEKAVELGSTREGYEMHSKVGPLQRELEEDSAEKGVPPSERGDGSDEQD
jgi:hypothetical protein